MDKEALEKQLVELNEDNLGAQVSNYKLGYRVKYFSQKADMSKQRIDLLNDKLQFLTSNMAKQIKEQGDHAQSVEMEYKKLQMDLDRQREEFKGKTGRLEKLNAASAARVHICHICNA